MAKGAGMLAPALATMLVVVTTGCRCRRRSMPCSALGDGDHLDRIDSDGSMSTNDTVLLMASGAAGVTPRRPTSLTAAASPRSARPRARQLIADAEGATTTSPRGGTAATGDDAVEVAAPSHATTSSSAAVFGNDPNWGRVLAAVGTTSCRLDPHLLDVTMNGIEVCRAGAWGGPLPST